MKTVRVRATKVGSRCTFSFDMEERYEGKYREADNNAHENLLQIAKRVNASQEHGSAAKEGVLAGVLDSCIHFSTHSSGAHLSSHAFLQGDGQRLSGQRRLIHFQAALIDLPDIPPVNDIPPF